jgi:hypothetical protein
VASKNPRMRVRQNVAVRIGRPLKSSEMKLTPIEAPGSSVEENRPPGWWTAEQRMLHTIALPASQRS